MNRMRSPFGGKLVPVCVIAVLLFCTPLQLAGQPQESPRADLHASWPATFWAALAYLVEAIFAADQKPTPPPATTGADCGAGIDPTGGCRG